MSIIEYKDDRTADGGPGSIPFVGWSLAAHEFRAKAAEFAPSGSVRPLFIGDPGVGKETMAQAWLAVGPQDGDRALKFVDLDKRSFLPRRRYLGVTTYRPLDGRLVAVLGRGVREELPASPEMGRTLVDAFWHYFDLALFMPPIRSDRQIDVLAFLDFWHQARSARARLRYRRIAGPLLHRMIFEDQFPNNLDGIYAHLRMLGNADRMILGQADEGSSILDVETLRDGPGSRSSESNLTAPAAADEEPAGWDPEGVAFESLPDIAVRMYLWWLPTRIARTNGPRWRRRPMRTIIPGPDR